MGRRPFCHEWKPEWAKGQNVSQGKSEPSPSEVC
ncbi:hypothetical protein CsSME_00004087 [Camellia sinensis var. sinensis]